MVFAVLGLAAFYLGLCYVLATNYIHPMRRVSILPPGLQEISIPSRYGPTPSWCTPSFQSKTCSPVVFLLAHGYGGSRASWTEAMLRLHERGYDSVALSMPGQDASPVEEVGFGILEGHVIVDAVKWLRAQKPGHKIVVLGISMGGAATWLAAQEDPDIDGIVTDCAFARFDEPMKAFFDRKLPGGRVILMPVVWIAERLAHVDPASIKPVDAAVLWKGKPALVIQGAADTLVVPSHAKRLAVAAACPLWLVPGAEHAESFEVDTKDYLDHLDSFASRVRVKSH